MPQTKKTPQSRQANKKTKQKTKDKKDLGFFDLPWRDNKTIFYQYLILLQLAFILILVGYYAYLYGGFSYLPHYSSQTPIEIENIRPRSFSSTATDEITAKTYRDGFNQSTIELEKDFIYLEERINTYYVRNREYPKNLDELVPDYINANEIRPEFKYYVNESADEFEINVDLGDLAAGLMANDGGNDSSIYELGTDLTIK